MFKCLRYADDVVNDLFFPGFSSLAFDSTCTRLFASCMDNLIYQFDCAAFSTAPGNQQCYFIRVTSRSKGLLIQSVSGTLDWPRVVAPSKTCGHVRSSRRRWRWAQCRPRSAAPTFGRVVLAGASTPVWCPVYRLCEHPQPGVVRSGLVSLPVVAARDYWSGTKESWNRTFLLQSVKKRKLSYYGYVLWKEGNCMEKEIMQVLLLVKEDKEDQEHVGRIK